MVGFQICNKEGEAITINQLDKEAAEFWGKEPHVKWYATPTGQSNSYSNWYDMLGRAILDEDKYRTHWTNWSEPYKKMAWCEVVCRMSLVNINDVLVDANKPEGAERYEMTIRSEKDAIEVLLGARMFLLPFMELAKHWEDKGYYPVRVE